MKSSFKELPIIRDSDERLSRGTEWGGMYVYVGEVYQTNAHSSSSPGMPDEYCQCPHWGYVLKGQLRFDIAGQEEVFNEGDLFYVPPEHTVLSEEAGTQYIILMPSDEWEKEVAKRGGQDKTE